MILILITSNSDSDSDSISEAISYNAAITSCASADGSVWEQALGLLAGMEQPVAISYCAMIDVCSKHEALGKALVLLAEMPRRGLEVNGVAYGAALVAAERCSQWRRASALLREMGEAGLRADVQTHRAAIGACEKCREWQGGLALLREVPLMGLEANLKLWNAAVSACEKGLVWERALGLLAEARGRGVRVDPITCSSLISACDKSGRWAEALQCLAGMQASSLEANGLDFGSVISACQKAGSWDRALAVLGLARASWDADDDDGAPEAPEADARVAARADVLLQGCGVIAVAKPPNVETGSVLARLARDAGPLTTVSRLDIQTSGVLVAALGGDSSVAAQLVRAQFAGRLVAKQYLCLCAGRLLGPPGTTGEVGSPLGLRVEANSCKAMVSKSGREALTKYRIPSL